MAYAESWSVIGSLWETSFTIGSLVRIDSPRSPWSARRSHFRYWTGIGSRRPYFCRTSSMPAASASVPAITRAGSPGIIRTPVNTMSVMRNSVTSEMRVRWIRNSVTTFRGCGWPREPGGGPADQSDLVPAHALDADQPVRHGLVALQVLREGRDVVLMIEVNDVATRGELVDRLPVELGALRNVAHLARLVQQGIDRLVAGLCRVEAPLAGVELVDVRVGIDATAPADQEGRKLARVVRIQGGGELHRLDRDVEAGLLGHLLDHLTDPAVRRLVLHGHLEAVAIGEASVGQELLGARHVARRALSALVVEGAHRRDGRAVRRVLALPDDLVQRLAVDREL